MSVDLNNRTLARQAATKIVNAMPLGKALNTMTESPEQQLESRRKEAMVKQVAALIEETYAPWCNEEFR